MNLVFADGARQGNRSRRLMGQLVAVGGVNLPGESVGALKRYIQDLCAQVGSSTRSGVHVTGVQMDIHGILATVVLIVQVEGGQSVGTATGFFYLKDERIYLVTNRHVVRDEHRNHRPDLLRLGMHASASLGPAVDLDVPLYANGDPLWSAHPKYPSPEIDIAVVQLDQKAVKQGHFLKTLSSENFLPDNLVISPGEDVMVIGFPRGLADSPHNLPILRSAMIASAFGVPFRGRPMFLVDANLHPGMSGSPVITRPKNMWQTKEGNTSMMTGMPMYLLGIHSATLGVTLPTGTEPLGLGAVWYADLIDQIIAAIGAK